MRPSKGAISHAPGGHGDRDQGGPGPLQQPGDLTRRGTSREDVVDQNHAHALKIIPRAEPKSLAV